MIRSLFVAIALALGLSWASANEGKSQDQPIVFWKTVGSWGVWVDRRIGNNCFIATEYGDDTIFRLGFLSDEYRSPAYFAVGNMNWQSLEEGKDYDLTIQMDNREPWRAQARAMKGKQGEIPYLSVEAGEYEFFEEFVRKHSLTISYKGQVVVRLNLRGSAAAMREMLACQEAIREDAKKAPAQPKQDPFEGVTSSKDPFQL